jgi:hypothetical protein
MSRATLLLFAGSLLAATALGCAQDVADDDAGDDAITSNDAKILSFKFEADVVAPKTTETRAAVLSQLAYVQGMLTTTQSGNGHVGHVELSNVRETVSGDKKTIHYSALLPVAWPKGKKSPKTYDLVLPKDTTALDDFNSKYDGKCGKDEYGVGDFWHDWNPKATGCKLDEADVVHARAGVTKYAGETTNKYPEYDKIWEDGRLDVVAMFGIIESNTPGDIGISEYESFVSNVQGLVKNPTTKTAMTSNSVLRDTTIAGTVDYKGQARPVTVTVFLVEALKDAGPDFDARYAQVNGKADLILYNGHAGLGKNVNALMRKGTVEKGKYQLVLLNGCQTFAYIDTTMNERRTQVNGVQDDPKGTKYLDVIGNTLPGYANNLSRMATSVFTAAAKADQPRSFNDLLKDMPPEHIVVVFGEEDNAFKP